MTTARPRRLLAVLGIAFLLVTAGLVSSSSSAASHSGHLEFKGPGSAYTHGPTGLTAEAVGAGSTAAYEIRVVNTGTELGQFNLRVETYGLPSNANLYSGSLSLSPMSAGPDGYWTAPIKPGAYQALVLKVNIPAGSTQGTAFAQVQLNASNGTLLEYNYMRTEVKAPSNGTLAYDLFAHQGSQPPVGGSVGGQGTASPALNIGQSGVYKVELQNDGPVPAVIRAAIVLSSSCLTMVVKDGTADVTAAVVANSYTTPVLAVHGSRTLTVTLKHVSAACGTSYGYATAYAHRPSDLYYFDGIAAFLLAPFGPA
jgi:hypothetical protein